MEEAGWTESTGSPERCQLAFYFLNSVYGAFLQSRLRSGFADFIYFCLGTLHVCGMLTKSFPHSENVFEILT